MDFNLDLFKVDRKNRTPQKGKILISEPFLNDSSFGRSVVLLTDHQSEGSVGFILNRNTDLKISEFIEDLPGNFIVSYGGPVETNTLHFLHNLGNKIRNSVKINDHLFWGGDFEQLKELIFQKKANPLNIRFFVGYSGWAADQLVNEIKNNYWVVTDFTGKDYLKIDETLWEKCLNDLGGKYKSWVNVPIHPDMN